MSGLQLYTVTWHGDDDALFYRNTEIYSVQATSAIDAQNYIALRYGANHRDLSVKNIEIHHAKL